MSAPPIGNTRPTPRTSDEPGGQQTDRGHQVDRDPLEGEEAARTRAARRRIKATFSGRLAPGSTICRLAGQILPCELGVGHHGCPRRSLRRSGRERHRDLRRPLSPSPMTSGTVATRYVWKDAWAIQPTGPRHHQRWEAAPPEAVEEGHQLRHGGHLDALGERQAPMPVPAPTAPMTMKSRADVVVGTPARPASATIAMPMPSAAGAVAAYTVRSCRGSCLIPKMKSMIAPGRPA